MLMTFGEAFAEMIRKRKLSVSSVAEDLGFTSKTALFRIIKDESKPQSSRNCLELAKKSRRLNLSPEEIEELERALKVSTIGAEAYVMYQVFDQMLHPRIPSDEAADIRLEGCREAESFEGLLGFYQPLSNIRITIYGKCEPEVIERIHRFTQRADVQRIWHVTNMDERSPDDIGILGAAANILFSPIYRLCVIGSKDNADQNWMFRSGMILLSADITEKKRCAHQLAPLHDGGYFAVRSDKGVFQSLWKRMFEDSKDRMVVIKRDQSNINIKPFPYNYIEFIEEYARIERGREIYMIKPDIPICCIPAPIILEPVEEGFREFGLRPEEKSLIDRMYEIHEARCRNFFEKSKPTHIILSREAMERFALTGRRSDHLFFPRPYTPKERVKILQNLLSNIKKNRQFHIWFAKGDSLVSDKEITCYDGVGLAVIRSDTSWRLEGDHQEIFIENKIISSYFKQYVLNEVLSNHVIPEQESFGIIKELINIAKKAE